MGENRLMADLCAENERLKARIEELEEKHFNECRQIAYYSDKLRRTKELLKAAVEDLSCGGENNKCTKSCKTCTYNSIKGYGCRYFGEYHWRYEAEALALIGEDTNVLENIYDNPELIGGEK